MFTLFFYNSNEIHVHVKPGSSLSNGAYHFAFERRDVFSVFIFYSFLRKIHLFLRWQHRVATNDEQ